MKSRNQTEAGLFSARYQLLIFLLGTGVALAAIFIQGTDRVFFPDAVDYLRVAEGLLAGDGYTRSHGFIPIFRPPLYPFFIGAVWLVFPKSIVAVQIVQTIIFGATALLLAKLAFFIFRNKQIALLTGVAYCFNPFAVILATDIQSECLHTLLVLAGVFLLLKANRTRNGLLFFLSGLTWGAAVLNRPSALPVGVFLFALVFLFNLKKINFVGNVRQSLLMPVLGLVLIVAPWTFANYRATGDFILVSDAGGYTMWLGNNPLLMRMYDGSIKNADEYKEFVAYMPGQIGAPGITQEKIDGFEKTTGYYNLSLKGREKLWQTETFEYMSESPGRTLRLFGHKFWDYWRPYLMPLAYSTRTVLISLVYFSAFYLLAFLGGWNLFKKENGKFYLCVFLAVFLVSTAVHVAIISMVRYRLPYVEPYLTVLAMAGLWHLFAKITRRAGLNWVPFLEEKM